MTERTIETQITPDRKKPDQTKTDPKTPRRPGTEVPGDAEREERPDKAPADHGEHEGATEEEVGDRTGPGAGYDIPEVPDRDQPGS